VISTYLHDRTLLIPWQPVGRQLRIFGEPAEWPDRHRQRLGMGSPIAAPEIATSGLSRTSRQQRWGRCRPSVGRRIAGFPAELDGNERRTGNDDARNRVIADEA
jgi:hypothetical protein